MLLEFGLRRLNGENHKDDSADDDQASDDDGHDGEFEPVAVLGSAAADGGHEADLLLSPEIGEDTGDDHGDAIDCESAFEEVGVLLKGLPGLDGFAVSKLRKEGDEGGNQGHQEEHEVLEVDEVAIGIGASGEVSDPRAEEGKREAEVCGGQGASDERHGLVAIFLLTSGTFVAMRRMMTARM